MERFAQEMTATLYGNPHSGSWSSQLSTMRIEDIRLRLLSFFNADPADYDLVFVANATAGVKLVVEAMRALPKGYALAYHEACHTSLIGAREDAQLNECLDDQGVKDWALRNPFVDADSSATLFAFSAQSHMDGKRYPVTWAKEVKDHSSGRSAPLFTLLDAASYSATSPLDLGAPDFSADFTVLSLYKIFGFPDLGALIVRRSAEHVFDRRRYFGGGTVDMVLCNKEQWHVRKSTFLHERLEDGTLPFHSIMALDVAMTEHGRLFGSMSQVREHTSHLFRMLWHGLRNLSHSNGLPVCVMYTAAPESDEHLGNGPVVTFNLKNSAGGWVSLGEVEKLANVQKVHIRTGGLCSPGKVASALGLEPWEMRRNLSAGFRCGADSEILGGKPTGVIRASVGAMSIESDVERFLAFVREFYVEQAPAQPLTPPPEDVFTPPDSVDVKVKTIAVYPIKSCGAYFIPEGVDWEVRPEGLAWDREWCLVHSGSRQALSQKRHTKMALLKPTLDFETGMLRVSYGQEEVRIPLSGDPAMFDSRSKELSSRVCGEEITAQNYACDEINGFFSRALDLPCVLARFPAGGGGLSSRSSKVRVQRHQLGGRNRKLPGSFPGMPSPPDSDAEQAAEGRILLSNESPILLVNGRSVDALNEQIQAAGGDAVTDASFRANVVVDAGDKCRNAQGAYLEDSWSRVRIGDQNFKLMGSCRRCQMVCVDQETGIKRQEPLSTLAKTRRFDGKVYFGSHMRHEPTQRGGLTNQWPTIRVGQALTVEEWMS